MGHCQPSRRGPRHRGAMLGLDKPELLWDWVAAEQGASCQVKDHDSWALPGKGCHPGHLQDTGPCPSEDVRERWEAGKSSSQRVHDPFGLHHHPSATTPILPLWSSVKAPSRAVSVNLKRSITKGYILIFDNKTQPSWCHQYVIFTSSSHLLGLEINMTLGVCLLISHQPLQNAEAPWRPCANHSLGRPGFFQHKGLPSPMHQFEDLFWSEAYQPPLASPVNLLMLYANKDCFIFFPMYMLFFLFFFFFIFILLFFFALLHQLGIPIWCCIEVVRMDTLALFYI